jgi:hypothetical protein
MKIDQVRAPHPARWSVFVQGDTIRSESELGSDGHFTSALPYQ